MEEKGYIRKSISIGVDLWNEIPENLIESNFSGFVQDSIRLKLKSIKIQDVREYLDNLNSEEIILLKREIENR